MSVILAFCFGCVAGSLVTQYWPWVRGAAGKARGAVFGRPPARAASLTEAKAPAAEPKRFDAGAFARGVLDWIKSFIGFVVRYWQIIAVAIFVLIAWTVLARAWSFVTCPFGGALYCFTESDDSAELREARNDTRVAEHETNVGQVGAAAGERTLRDARRRDHVIAQAEQELEDAVSQADFDGLHSAYARAHSELWSGYRATGEPDQPESRSGPVHSPPANPV